MLAGPPRLVSLISILLLLGLGWWYLNLVRLPSVPSIGIKIDAEPPPPPPPPPSQSKTGSSNSEIDFGIPLRFKDGVPKPPGSNYTSVIVVPKTKKEDIAWMYAEMPEIPIVAYEVDNPNAQHKIPKNKGREAMVYLTYLIDHYDDLPDTVLFMHAHRYAWHNNQLMGLDTVQMLRRLNHDRVARMGYMNVRCHHEPGCPDWIHMDRPGGDFDFYLKPEEIYIRRHVWEEIHPGAPIPPSLSGICCAQFAVSRDRIRQVPLERLLWYRRWLLETTIDDQFSGRIFEYIWHYIFTAHEVYCPAMNTCYCDGYGFCFGGQKKFSDYFKKQEERNKLNEELREYTDVEDKAAEEGWTKSWSEMEKAKMEKLKKKIGTFDLELINEREAALERGKDPKARAEETENWDSTHIWDYAPDGPKGPKGS